MSDAFESALTDAARFLLEIGWIIVVVIVLLWLSGKAREHISYEMSKRGSDASVTILISNLIRFATYFLVGLLLIGEITGDASSIVTAIGLIAAAISLSLQDVLRNFVSGIYLLLERPFRPGDTIRVVDQVGSVDRIDIRTTVLRNARNEEVFVPNFKVFSEVVKREPENYSTRFSVKSPGPVHATFDAIWQAAMMVKVDKSPPPSVKITGAGESDVDFQATIWQPQGTDQSEAFIAAVKTSLENATVKKIVES